MQEAAQIAAVAAHNLPLAELIAAWLMNGVRREDKNAVLIRVFNADVVPVIGHIPVRAFSEADIRRVIHAQVSRGVNRTAVATYKSLMQMFLWA